MRPNNPSLIAKSTMWTATTTKIVLLKCKKYFFHVTKACDTLYLLLLKNELSTLTLIIIWSGSLHGSCTSYQLLSRRDNLTQTFDHFDYKQHATKYHPYTPIQVCDYFVINFLLETPIFLWIIVMLQIHL